MTESEDCVNIENSETSTKLPFDEDSSNNYLSLSLSGRLDLEGERTAHYSHDRLESLHDVLLSALSTLLWHRLVLRHRLALGAWLVLRLLGRSLNRDLSKKEIKDKRENRKEVCTRVELFILSILKK